MLHWLSLARAIEPINNDVQKFHLKAYQCSVRCCRLAWEVLRKSNYDFNGWSQRIKFVNLPKWPQPSWNALLRYQRAWSTAIAGIVATMTVTPPNAGGRFRLTLSVMLLAIPASLGCKLPFADIEGDEFSKSFKIQEFRLFCPDLKCPMGVIFDAFSDRHPSPLIFSAAVVEKICIGCPTTSFEQHASLVACIHTHFPICNSFRDPKLPANFKIVKQSLLIGWLRRHFIKFEHSVWCPSTTERLLLQIFICKTIVGAVREFKLVRYIVQTTNFQEFNHPRPLCSISSRILSSSIVFATLAVTARVTLFLQRIGKDRVKVDYAADDRG